MLGVQLEYAGRAGALCCLTDGTCGMLLQVVVRCIWRILLPLLDLGYQVDVRIMNSAHYAVPQLRRVILSFS